MPLRTLSFMHRMIGINLDKTRRARHEPFIPGQRQDQDTDGNSQPGRKGETRFEAPFPPLWILDVSFVAFCFSLPRGPITQGWLGLWICGSLQSTTTTKVHDNAIVTFTDGVLLLYTPFY